MENITNTTISTAPVVAKKKLKAKRKSKASASSDGPPRKAGNQGNFHGPRRAFLESLVESYLAAVQAHKTPEFWSPTYAAFHEKFDWRIGLKDPYPDDHAYSVEEDDGDLNDEAVASKKERVADTNKVRLYRL